MAEPEEKPNSKGGDGMIESVEHTVGRVPKNRRGNVEEITSFSDRKRHSPAKDRWSRG